MVINLKELREKSFYFLGEELDDFVDAYVISRGYKELRNFVDKNGGVNTILKMMGNVKCDEIDIYRVCSSFLIKKYIKEKVLINGR